jgi:hypothetical protein
MLRMTRDLRPLAGAAGLSALGDVLAFPPLAVFALLMLLSNRPTEGSASHARIQS